MHMLLPMDKISWSFLTDDTCLADVCCRYNYGSFIKAITYWSVIPLLAKEIIQILWEKQKAYFHWKLNHCFSNDHLRTIINKPNEKQRWILCKAGAQKQLHEDLKHLLEGRKVLAGGDVHSGFGEILLSVCLVSRVTFTLCNLPDHSLPYTCAIFRFILTVQYGNSNVSFPLLAVHTH